MSLVRAFSRFRQALLLLFTLSLTACATTDLQLKPVYQPVGGFKGAGGTLVLVSPLEGTAPGDGARTQWLLGEIRDTDGQVKGNVVSPVAPAALVRSALQQELSKAGYAVQLEQRLPEGVEQGLVLHASTLQLDETSSLVKIEAECRVSFSVEIWQKGVKSTTLSFESRFSDFAVRDREKLHQSVVQKAFASAFKRAVPAIMEQLKK